MRRLLHFTERKKTNLVTLTNFFKRPPNDHVTRQSPATIRRPPEGGDGGPHGKARSDCMTSLGVMIFRIVALRVLPLCGRTTGGPHDTRPNFSRSVESEDAGRHCLAQLRWIEADRPEEFFASAAATPPKAAAFPLRGRFVDKNFKTWGQAVETLDRKSALNPVARPAAPASPPPPRRAAAFRDAP
jgi:hypothetical protein